MPDLDSRLDELDRKLARMVGTTDQIKAGIELLTEQRDALLAAAEAAENWLGELGHDSPDEGLRGLFAQLRAAIALAKGEDA